MEETLIEIRTDHPAVVKTDILVVAVFEDEAAYTDPQIQELADRARDWPEFSGKSGDELMFYDIQGVKAKRVVVLGIGRAEDADRETVRKACGKAVNRAVAADLASLLICIPEPGGKASGRKAAAEAMMEGAVLANYRFDLYKKEKKHKPINKIEFYAEAGFENQARRIAKKTEIVCQGTLLARDWVSMPSNDKRPTRLARSIAKAAEKEPLETVVLDTADLKKNRMRAFLSVASGSSSRPQMVVLDHRPESWEKTIVLVGKGVTFDSGGINIKPASGLEGMKQDMAGAAAVAATLICAARTGFAQRLVGVAPLVENMPSGTAYRPGDIVKTASGKTVEIGNTDAEGRMILADALDYAINQYAPDVVIDLATLTGACIVALGEKIAGVFSPDAKLSGLIADSGQKTYERCWSMPMPEDYRELLKSDFADIRNVGKDRWGGAIAAALFLSEFTKGARWAHIDIAGPAFASKAHDYCQPGGTGFGVRLLMDLIEKL
ncbi:MAG: leucyl aminopeptidase [Desulfobacteraceae bacterium]|nr:leucyl aminopeptidase [Desulfobacteraceae bacterium]MCF8093799.1 leucyl aminopeptidase [Desulfobacteraceae bacterium]